MRNFNTFFIFFIVFMFVQSLFSFFGLIYCSIRAVFQEKFIAHFYGFLGAVD